MTTPTPDNRMLSTKDVIYLTGLSRSTLHVYRRSDAFPAPRKIGPNRIAWLEADVRHWMTTRPTA